MKIKTFGIMSVMLVFGFATLSLTASQNEASGSTSNVETFQFTSKTFNNTRTIRVLLPPGYRDQENAAKRYPVFYFTDGIVVFRPDRINIEEVVYKLVGDKEIPPIIVVGIDNGGSTDKTKDPGVDRANEFLPYPDVGFPSHLNKPEAPNPQGKLYPAFLVDEVMPMIHQRYRVKTGRSDTAVGGVSYGGVAALYAVMTRPEVFGKLLLESTPLWIGPERRLLKDAEKIRKWPAFVYLAIGTQESPDESVNAEGRQNLQSLRKAIETRAPGTALKVVLEEGGKHEASSWRGRLPAALRFLWGSEKRDVGGKVSTHPVAVQAAERPASASGTMEGEIVIAQVERLEYKAHEEWLEDGTVWVTNVVALDVVAPRHLDKLLLAHVAGHPRINGRPLLLGDRVTFALPKDWRVRDLALDELPGLKFVE